MKRPNPKRVAAYIVSEVIQNQRNNVCLVTFMDIVMALKLEYISWSKDKRFLACLRHELFRYPQFGEGAQIEITDEGFSCIAYPCYTLHCLEAKE